MDKQKILIVIGFIIMFVLGMAALQFMKSVEVMSDDTLKEIKYNASFIGYNTALLEVLNGVSDCSKPIYRINFNNETINLVSVECLNQLNNEGGK